MTSPSDLNVSIELVNGWLPAPARSQEKANGDQTSSGNYDNLVNVASSSSLVADVARRPQGSPSADQQLNEASAAAALAAADALRKSTQAAATGASTSNSGGSLVNSDIQMIRDINNVVKLLGSANSHVGATGSKKSVSVIASTSR